MQFGSALTFPRWYPEQSLWKLWKQPVLLILNDKISALFLNFAIEMFYGTDRNFEEQFRAYQFRMNFARKLFSDQEYTVFH